MLMKEIASAEDQLALWKLISDNTWTALGTQIAQAVPPKAAAATARKYAKPIAEPIAKPVAKPVAKLPSKNRAAAKPKRAPMAPAPKPLPQPKPLQLTPAQTSKLQSQQHQQLAQHIHQALAKKSPARAYPQTIGPKGPVPTTTSASTPTTSYPPLAKPVSPMNNSYDQRDLDDLVRHRRQNPFKPLDLR